MNRHVSALTLLVVVGLAATVRTADVKTLSLTPEQRRRCLDVLRQALKGKGDDFWPAMHAAEAFTQAGHRDEVRAALTGRLKEEKDARKRCGLARELVRAGDRTRVAVLLEILAKPELDAQVHAAESLYKIGEIGDGELLRKAMAHDDKVALQMMAAAALARRGDRSALALIRKRLAGSDPEGRMLAAFVIARLGDETDLPPLRQNARREEDLLKRSFALHALASLGDRAGREALSRNLTSTDPEVRAYAAEMAGVSRAADLADRLTRLLDDKAVDVRVRAAQALLTLAQPAPAR
jgi:sialidase-1